MKAKGRGLIQGTAQNMLDVAEESNETTQSISKNQAPPEFKAGVLTTRLLHNTKFHITSLCNVDGQHETCFNNTTTKTRNRPMAWTKKNENI
jgi:hypothetical protein